MTDVLPSPSGLPAVDNQWGGLASGGAYLLVGRAGAGRSALALQTARASVEAGDRVLVISPRAPESLVEVGREIGLDLASAHQAGKLRLLRIPSASDLAARGADGLAQSYRDLVGLVSSDHPARVVVEDFTPLVQFDTFARFREAFEHLIDELRDQSVTLLIGLGEPGNDASRRLLEVVEDLVDGTIRLSGNGTLHLSRPSAPTASNDGASVDTHAPAPPDADRQPAHAEAPAAPSAPLAAPADEAPVVEPSADTSPAYEPPSYDPSAYEADSFEAPEAPALPAAPEIDPFSLATEDLAGDGFSTTFSTPSQTSGSEEPPAAPVAHAPTPDAPTPVSPPDAASARSVPPPTEVVPPPAADASLLAPVADPFGYDPADTMLEQGYLADSNGGEVLGHVPSAPAPDPAPMPAFGSMGDLPSFAPLGASPPSPEAAFRTALDAAFAAQQSGTPFVIVALRMEPTAPESGFFGAVEAALRASLRPADQILVDGARKRAIVLLPEAGPDAATALFTGLQSHLTSTIGADAERVRQAIGAVTIPNGQPFQAAADLLAYAYEG